MAKVLVHYKRSPDDEFNNLFNEFAQVPAVGEYIALTLNSEWLRVDTVVHRTLGSGYDAEVYSTPIQASDRHKLILF